MFNGGTRRTSERVRLRERIQRDRSGRLERTFSGKTRMISRKLLILLVLASVQPALLLAQERSVVPAGSVTGLRWRFGGDYVATRIRRP